MKSRQAITAGGWIIAIAAITSLSIVAFADSKKLYYQVMRIDARGMQELIRDDGFHTLYLNQKYDHNSIFKQDESSLVASAWSRDLGGPIGLGQNFIVKIDDGRELECNVFSNFILTRESVAYLSLLRDVEYFLFIPQTFRDNPEYIGFEVQAFSASGRVDVEARYQMLNPCPPAKPY